MPEKTESLSSWLKSLTNMATPEGKSVDFLFEVPPKGAVFLKGGARNIRSIGGGWEHPREFHMNPPSLLHMVSGGVRAVYICVTVAQVYNIPEDRMLPIKNIIMNKLRKGNTIYEFEWAINYGKYNLKDLRGNLTLEEYRSLLWMHMQSREKREEMLESWKSAAWDERHESLKKKRLKSVIKLGMEKEKAQILVDSVQGELVRCASKWYMSIKNTDLYKHKKALLLLFENKDYEEIVQHLQSLGYAKPEIYGSLYWHVRDAIIAVLNLL